MEGLSPGEQGQTEKRSISEVFKNASYELADEFKKMGIGTLEVVSQKFGETIGRKVYDYLRLRTEGFETDIVGIEHIMETEGPFILATNHTRPTGQISLQTGAHPDIVILEKLVEETVGTRPAVIAKGDPGEWGSASIGVKKNLLKPVMTGIVRGLGFIPVGLLPGSFNRELVEKVSETITEDRSVIIAPEGRSYEEFSPDNEFKTGAAHFSLKHNVPIIPVFIKDCRDWKAGSKNAVLFGEPIYPQNGMNKAELTDLVKDGVVFLSQEAQELEN